jgi:DNA topoisomerase-1
MDREVPSSKDLPTGISIRNGPVEEMDVDKPDISQVNGTVTGKRKSRGSLVKNYAEANSASDDDDDDKPLVCRSSASSRKVSHH